MLKRSEAIYPNLFLLFSTLYYRNDRRINPHIFRLNLNPPTILAALSTTIMVGHNALGDYSLVTLQFVSLLIVSVWALLLTKIQLNLPQIPIFQHNMISPLPANTLPGMAESNHQFMAVFLANMSYFPH
eukprot:sb/3475292/